MVAAYGCYQARGRVATEDFEMLLQENGCGRGRFRYGF